MSAFSLNRKISFETVECGACHMLFAITSAFQRQCKEDGRAFRCPDPKCSWDTQSYCETDVDKFKKELKEAEAAKARADQARRWAEESRDCERRSHAATRGHLTRAKTRAAAAVCPCCNRSFKQLRRHMRSKHPDYLGSLKEKA